MNKIATTCMPKEYEKSQIFIMELTIETAKRRIESIIIMLPKVDNENCLFPVVFVPETRPFKVSSLPSTPSCAIIDILLLTFRLYKYHCHCGGIFLICRFLKLALKTSFSHAYNK